MISWSFLCMETSETRKVDKHHNAGVKRSLASWKCAQRTQFRRTNESITKNLGICEAATPANFLRVGSLFPNCAVGIDVLIVPRMVSLDNRSKRRAGSHLVA